MSTGIVAGIEQAAVESSIAADTAAAAALPEHKDCFAHVAFVVKSFAAAGLHTEVVARNQILTAVAAVEALVEWFAEDNRRQNAIVAGAGFVAEHTVEVETGEGCQTDYSRQFVMILLLDSVVAERRDCFAG